MEMRQHSEVKEVLAKLDQQLTAIYEGRQIAAMAAALVYDQEILWSKGYGYADLDRRIPADAQTVFDIGSIVKIFTDTMLMQLRDAGKVNLDDPIEKHLPAFRLKRTERNEPPPTFRQTAGHIAGIPREPGYFIGSKGVPELPTIEAILEQVPEMTYIYPPMEGIHYSNLGVYVMGHALAQIAGQPYQQYVHEHILQPLGMRQSGWSCTNEMEAHRAVKYIPLHENKPRTLASEMAFGDTGAPGGGFYSTVEDLARFISFQFHQGSPEASRVLSANSLKEMRLPVFAEPWGGVGIGWWLDRVCDHKTIHHGGSSPGCSAAIRLAPDLKLGVVILINEMIFTENAMARDALELVIPVFDQLLKESQPPATRPPLPPEASSCAGSYRTPGDAWGAEVHIENGQMKALLQYAALDLLWFDMVHEAGSRYIIQGSSFDQEKVSFEYAPDGTVKTMVLWGLPFLKQ